MHNEDLQLNQRGGIEAQEITVMGRDALYAGKSGGGLATVPMTTGQTSAQRAMMAREAAELDAMNAATRLRFGLPPLVVKIERATSKVQHRRAKTEAKAEAVKMPVPRVAPTVNGSRVECLDVVRSRALQELVREVCCIYGVRPFFMRAGRVPAGSVDHLRNAPMVTLALARKAMNGLWEVAVNGYASRGQKRTLPLPLVKRIHALAKEVRA